MNIRNEIAKEVRRLESCVSQLPPSVNEIMFAGKTLLQMDDDLLKREHMRYGANIAIIFMAMYATGYTPEEIGIRSMRRQR